VAAANIFIIAERCLNLLGTEVSFSIPYPINKNRLVAIPLKKNTVYNSENFRLILLSSGVIHVHLVHLVLTLSYDRQILPLRPFYCSLKSIKTLPNISPFSIFGLNCHSKHVFHTLSQKSLLQWQALGSMLTTEFTNPFQILCIFATSSVCVCMYICICTYTYKHVHLLDVYIFVHLLY